MARYLVSFELRQPAADYQALYKKLKSIEATRMLNSTWYFHRFDTNAKELMDHFKIFVDEDDAIIVTEVASWSAFNTKDVPKKLS